MMTAARDALTKPLLDENPVTLQVLGICSALAKNWPLAIDIAKIATEPSVNRQPNADSRGNRVSDQRQAVGHRPVSPRAGTAAALPLQAVECI